MRVENELLTEDQSPLKKVYMKYKRLLKIKKLEFACYASSEETELRKLLPDLDYLENPHISYNPQSTGIALRITFENLQSLSSPPTGVRRPIQIVLNDLSSGKELLVKELKLNISKNDYCYTCHFTFSFDEFLVGESIHYGLTFIDILKCTWMDDYEFYLERKSDEESEEIDDDDEEDTFTLLLNEWVSKGKRDLQTFPVKGQETEKQNFIESLNSLTGIRDVKRKLIKYESLVSFNKIRCELGLPVCSIPLHAMFMGSPGTGKTTVAKMMGEMLHKRGLLSKGHVVVKERATLLGQNYNSEGENTIAAIDEAQGGILFIDEAYQLYQPQDPRDPGKFVIETLLTALADPSKRDWMLILAGYPKEMMKMLEMNPGFKSRIPQSNLYMFEDFSESELMEIAENYFADYKYVLTPEAYMALAKRISYDFTHKDKNFGNARHVINLIQTEIIPAMAVRVMNDNNFSSESVSQIRMEDITVNSYVEKIEEYRRIGYVA